MNAREMVMVDQPAIGRSFTPVTAQVEAGRLKQFLKAVGENNPLYRDAEAAKAAGFAGVPIPPTYLFCLEMMDAEKPFEFLEVLNVDLGRVLHGAQSFSYHTSVVVGDTLTFQSRVTDVADKKGGALTFIRVETRVTNQAGAHVADMVRTIVVRN